MKNGKAKAVLYVCVYICVFGECNFLFFHLDNVEATTFTYRCCVNVLKKNVLKPILCW